MFNRRPDVFCTEILQQKPTHYIIVEIHDTYVDPRTIHQQEAHWGAEDGLVVVAQVRHPLLDPARNLVCNLIIDPQRKVWTSTPLRNYTYRVFEVVEINGGAYTH